MTVIVIERDFIARWVREMKRRQNSENQDYYTGYVCAMSTVEGMLAMCPEYDFEKLFSPGDVCKAMILHGQRDKHFKLGDTIRYSPTEVHDILNEARRGEI